MPAKLFEREKIDQSFLIHHFNSPEKVFSICMLLTTLHVQVWKQI